ncbi:MAG: hypothetical protein ACI4GY_03245 [Acutalibacteraceae bacterium]
MLDKKDFSAPVRERFEKLPAFVQETIMQSSAKFETVDELDAVANDIISSVKSNKKE